MPDPDVSPVSPGPPGAAAALSVRGLRKAFGDTVVLDEVDLDLHAGEVTVLTGANGAGKSTLLECLAGAQPYDAGQMRLHGRDADPTAREHWRVVHALLDDAAWFPGLTVLDHYRLLDPTLDADGATALLAELGAEQHLDRLPATLSSGQRQRCALIGTLVRPWEVLLLDEPERHLDRATVPALARLVLQLAERGPVLLATHDALLADLAELADLAGPTGGTRVRTLAVEGHRVVPGR